MVEKRGSKVANSINSSQSARQPPENGQQTPFFMSCYVVPSIPSECPVKPAEIHCAISITPSGCVRPVSRETCSPKLLVSGQWSVVSGQWSQDVCLVSRLWKSSKWSFEQVTVCGTNITLVLMQAPKNSCVINTPQNPAPMLVDRSHI